jgi:hypothetical protein
MRGCRRNHQWVSFVVPRRLSCLSRQLFFHHVTPMVIYSRTLFWCVDHPAREILKSCGGGSRGDQWARKKQWVTQEDSPPRVHFTPVGSSLQVSLWFRMITLTQAHVFVSIHRFSCTPVYIHWLTSTYSGTSNDFFKMRFRRVARPCIFVNSEECLCRLGNPGGVEGLS